MTVHAILDGKQLINWTGSPSQLPSLPEDAQRQMIVFAYKGFVKLHDLKLKMIDGEAKLLRPGDANQK